VFKARTFSAEKKCLCGATNADCVLGQWRPPAVWISPTKNNQQRQILQNLKLCKPLKRKRASRLTTRMRLLHDGAQPHTLAQTAAWLEKQKWKVLRHPLHSPALAPSDFYLFEPFKNFSPGKRFKDQNNISHPWKWTLQWKNV
jgi:hypothetical protein